VAEQEVKEDQASEKERVRVAINILRQDFEDLKRLAEEDGETLSAYFRKALATEKYLKDRMKKGGKILVEENGVQQEIVFR
jgi:hypothetical protein